MRRIVVLMVVLAGVCVTVTQAMAEDPKKIECSTSALSLGLKDGDELVVECPANCTTASVWGTDEYTGDSSVCVAAVHAGVITTSGGLVEVDMEGKVDSFSGSTRNGVTTSSWGAYDSSFEVESASAAASLSCADTGKSIDGEVGTIWSATCPADCTSGSVWGTDVYTDDSSICVAAVHAGKVGTSGGAITFEITGRHDSYKASERNGVSSSSWGAWDRSFVFK